MAKLNCANTTSFTAKSNARRAEEETNVLLSFLNVGKNLQ